MAAACRLEPRPRDAPSSLLPPPCSHCSLLPPSSLPSLHPPFFEPLTLGCGLVGLRSGAGQLPRRSCSRKSRLSITLGHMLRTDAPQRPLWGSGPRSHAGAGHAHGRSAQETGMNRFGSILFGSGLFNNSSARIGSVRFLIPC